MSALLEVDALSRHYPLRRGLFTPARTLRALDQVSFRLEAGRTLAVVGESGSGKSTLARQLCFLETPTAGDVRLDGTPLAHATRATLKRLRPQVQMVFQNPYASLNPRKRVSALLEEPLAINTTLDASERRSRALAMLERVGLSADQARRYPHMFSGGQRQRIAIARALMSSPRLIVADEPVSALDVSVQAQVLNLLMDLQAEHRLTYVFISHNLAVVEHIADEVLVMYLGRVVEQADKATLFAQPRHPYTQALLAATPRLGQATPVALVRGEAPSLLDAPVGCAYAGRCPHVRERCGVEAPSLREVAGSKVACHFAEQIAGDGTPLG
ncbi:dipeptide ABC transporter ATP-binding protein [Niveibacterium sp. SC-1]|uniref:dipeptide ABC transporter ATP-binding protein n=1 Tax=Niveibacterium sp. SC-1 TaxID=3135646 RepID=UPI00311E01C6